MNTILFFTILACFGYQAQAYICPCNWKYFDGRCYYISQGTANNWRAARAFCGARGGDLAVPTSKINNQHIYQAMKASNVGTAYIGFYRVAEGLGANKFYTVRGVEPSYTNWLAGEPNDAGGKEDCVELVYKSPFWKNGGDVGGQWNDLPCNGYPRHFVCQMSFQNSEN